MTDISRLLVVSDMDGTALIASKGVPEQNIEAVRRFTEKGGHFTFASGRSLQTLRMGAKPFAVNAPLIALNGSLIASPDGETILLDHPMPPSALEMADGVRAHFEGTDGVYAVGWETYYIISQSRESVELCKRMAMMPPVHSPLADIPEPLHKVAVFARVPEKTPKIRDWLRERYGEEYDIVISGERLVEIMERGVDKASGMREVGRMLGTDVIAAIGDNGNDVPMLRAADFSAVPGDAQPEARAAADRVLGRPCMDGALAELLNLLEKGEWGQ